MTLFTIGFTKKSARDFFTLLRESGARSVLDVRLHRTSQLAGFAKADDLAFFLEEVCRMSYDVEPLLAPTEDMLRAHRAQEVPWVEYERVYRRLLAERGVEARLSKERLDGSCLLCSEHEPRFCHRRLAAEILAQAWGDLKIIHLV